MQVYTVLRGGGVFVMFSRDECAASPFDLIALKLRFHVLKGKLDEK